MSKIIAELDVKNTNAAAVAKGVRGKIEKELAPLNGSTGPAAGVGRGVATMGLGAGVTAAKMALLAGAMVAAGAAARGMSSAIDFGGQMDDLEARTGIASGQLMILSRAFELAGLNAADVGPSIARLQKALSGVNEEGGPTNEMISRLGLELSDLRAMTPGAQFRAVGGAIAGLASPTERAAAAMAIFGRSGAELLSLFRDSGTFSEAAAQVGRQAEILDRNAGVFANVSDKLESVGLKVSGFAAGVAEWVAPTLAPLTNMLDGEDWAEAGQRFGKSLATHLVIATDRVQKLAGLVSGIADKVSVSYEELGAMVGISLPNPFKMFGDLVEKTGKKMFNTDPAAEWEAAAEKVEQFYATAQFKEDDRRRSRMSEAAALLAGMPDAPEMGDFGKTSGGAPTISRLFATTMGLFVKETPLLAETRRQSALLEKIERNTAPRAAGGQAFQSAPQALRFA